MDFHYRLIFSSKGSLNSTLPIQGVPKNKRIGRRLGGLLKDILERMKGHLIKPNM